MCRLKKRKPPEYGANYMEKLVKDLSTNDNLKGTYESVNSPVTRKMWWDLPEDDSFFQYMYKRVVTNSKEDKKKWEKS